MKEMQNRRKLWNNEHTHYRNGSTYLHGDNKIRSKTSYWHFLKLNRNGIRVHVSACVYTFVVTFPSANVLWHSANRLYSKSSHCTNELLGFSDCLFTLVVIVNCLRKRRYKTNDIVDDHRQTMENWPKKRENKWKLVWWSLFTT